MKKIYYLKTCSTCTKIMKDLNLDNVELVNIKEEPILKKDIEFAAEKLGGMDAVFSKRAMKYRSLGLDEQDLSEKDMKEWIMKEYTFLKRPLAIIEDEVFNGSAKKVVEGMKNALNG